MLAPIIINNFKSNLLKLAVVWKNPWLALSFFILVIGVFVLPWHVPQTFPVSGESYSLGYSNKIAVFSICLSMACAFLGILKNPFENEPLNWFYYKEDSFMSLFRASRIEYIILGSFSIIVTFFILIWNQILINPYWGESGYFLSRIDLVCLGFRPYKDFLYNYGPLLLYLPIWLDRLFLGILGIENAYAIIFAFGYIVGFFNIFIFLNALNIPNNSRSLILCISIIFWCTITMGLQCIPLRFTIAPCILIIFDRLIKCINKNRYKLIIIAAFVTSSSIICFSISPEMGFSSAAAFFAYSSVLLLAKKCSKASSVILGITGFFIVTFFLFGNYTHSMMGFGSGAFNFPIYPTLHTIIFIAANVYIFPQIAASVWKQPTHPCAPLAAALAVGAIFIMPAALGRCDPGHIQSNGIIALTLLFPVFASIGKKALSLWVGIYTLVFIGVLQLSYWNHYLENYKHAWSQFLSAAQYPAPLEESRRKWENEKRARFNGVNLNWHKTVPFPDNILCRSRTAAPIPLGEGVERFLALQDGFKPLWYPTRGSDMFSMNEVKNNFNACATFDFILLPSFYLNYFNTKIDILAYESQIQRFLSKLLIFPVRSHVKNYPFIPEMEFTQILLKNSDIVASNNGLILLKNRILNEEKNVCK
jgi:hypothetical protein